MEQLFFFGHGGRSRFRMGRLVCRTCSGAFLIFVTWTALAPAVLGQMEPQPVDEAERRAVVARIAELLEAHYVFPDVAAERGR